LSLTRKDANLPASTALEVIKRDDSTFDLLLNRELGRSHIPEAWLPEELCVRFGFCGEEYDSNLREVNQNGRATIMF
jgi:hypothetical protein